VFFGIAVAIVGVVLLLRTMGIFPKIDFEMSWPVILIIVGALIGIKNNFRRNAWWILIFIGAVNLIPQFMIMGRPSGHYVWPTAIILVGIMIATRPRRERFGHMRTLHSTISTDDTLAIDVSFGGRKEVVTSKDFKGGAINCTFGGVELNLTQADFTTPSVIIDCSVSFGGVEIIVPSHWDIQNEVSPSFGSVEDERSIHTPASAENRKILILRGSCSFGSIEVKSY
jgi:predicted membrane protein